LRRLSRLVSAIYDQHLQAAGLTTNQYGLLAILARGAMPLGQLARRAATDRTTLTRNLRPMTVAGWVNISAGQDARQKLVGLTTAGTALLNAAKPDWARAQTLIEATLGRTAVEDLHGAIAGAMVRLRDLRPDN